MMKEWFRARNSWGAAIRTLADEEAGRLMKALWEYTMTGNQVELQGIEKGIFALILFNLEQDEAHDKEVSHEAIQSNRQYQKTGIGRSQSKSIDIK